ncbi:hypothetical protein BDM02DRAFT_3092305 [Thelephora ganbajun]|uniref:Uncharacterized protein n=1 Tax=Thelephora ganbajun TaxID=370292 RepID=A0ACB6ZNB4_THEGA|nr:hypothetical protein BDM02DRAFT_3092305 [Thelephora ganbajun]
MSVAKYANLPYIDTAPDVYETEDVFPTNETTKGESEDEDQASASHRGKNTDPPASKEDLDSSNLISAAEASKKFKRAEKRSERHRARTRYAYPPSPTSSDPPESPTRGSPPLSYRLRTLRAELSALEADISDPTNPLLVNEQDSGIDPGELLRGLVDVRGRLENINGTKTGRGKLVHAVIDGARPSLPDASPTDSTPVGKRAERQVNLQDLAELDERVGELESVVGSSTASLDELSPLPPPLLPLLTRLNTQMTILTQPRHIDAISRRLKLLLSDLERAHQQQQQPQPHSQSSGSQRKPSAGQSTAISTSTAIGHPAAPQVLAEQLAPLVTRLAPSLPHIPHLLNRLRTLSALHASAAELEGTLDLLEKEQKVTRSTLNELSTAIESVEKSLEGNRDVVKGNVESLEGRVEELMKRISDLKGGDREG